MALNIRIIGVKWTSGRLLEARIFPPGGGGVAAVGSPDPFPLVESPAGSGQYGGRQAATLADTTDDPYEFEVREVLAPAQFGVSNVVAVPRRDLGWVFGGKWSRGFTPAELDAVLTASHGLGSWIGVIGPAGAVGQQPLLTSAALTAGVGDTFTQDFTFTGLDSTGWTHWLFTVKQDANSDDDDEALLVIHKTSPGNVNDGLVMRDGRQANAGDRALASITILSTAPDTVVRVTAAPEAMVIPPSPESAPWKYELTRWVGAERTRRAAGDFTVVRTLRRKLTAPY